MIEPSKQNKVNGADRSVQPSADHKRTYPPVRSRRAPRQDKPALDVSENNPAETSSTENLPNSGTRRRTRICSDAAWEVLRSELLPMHMENRTLPEIALHFGVSITTAHRWRARLLEDLSREALATSISPQEYVLEGMASLKLARTEAHRIKADSATLAERRAAVRTVVRVEEQAAKFGTLIGLYGRAGDQPLRRNAANAEDDLLILDELIQGFLGSASVPIEDDLEETGEHTGSAKDTKETT